MSAASPLPSGSLQPTEHTARRPGSGPHRHWARLAQAALGILRADNRGMHRDAPSAWDFLNLPADRVVELGAEVQI